MLRTLDVMIILSTKVKILITLHVFRIQVAGGYFQVLGDEFIKKSKKKIGNEWFREGTREVV